MDYIHSDFCGPSRTFNFLAGDIARSSGFQFRSKSLNVRIYCVGHTKDSIYPNFHIKLDKRIDNLIIYCYCLIQANVQTGRTVHQIPCRAAMNSVEWNPKYNLLAYAGDDKNKYQTDEGIAKFLLC